VPFHIVGPVLLFLLAGIGTTLFNRYSIYRRIATSTAMGAIATVYLVAQVECGGATAGGAVEVCIGTARGRVCYAVEEAVPALQ
jgi:uncharacterized membrane protein (DUF441 family)